MKVLLFILLAGYAVKCDDNNYYVIEMPKDLPTPKPFKVYWNVPTKQCKSKKIPFENLFEKFGIIQNDQDHFAGENVTILYDPGLFPALLKNETSGKFRFRNGGVPQEGDLNKHLEAFKQDLDQSIPDKNFSGIGIIDFESWRPVYRQNFGTLQPYKDVSLEIERKLHWWWQKKWLEAEAKSRFEEAARAFMQSTLAVAKQQRPRALWGFYGFPYCFNMASNNLMETCASNVPEENDNISWLWNESTALYPSVYSSASLNTAQLTALIRGRVREAARFKKLILPYFWYRYRDAGFLTEVDLNAALETLYKSNASGFIIWGSSNDVKTVEKCTKLLNYIEQVMGPAIAKYTKPTNRIHDEIINDIVNITTNDTSFVTDNKNTEHTTKSGIYVTNTTSPSITDIGIKEFDPEYHWTTPKDYTQDIKNNVAEEISKKLINSTRSQDKNTVLDNTVLTDLILNSVNNNVHNSKQNTTNISYEENETTEIGNRNDLSEELLTSASTQANTVLEVGSTTVTSHYEENNEVNAINTNNIHSTTIRIKDYVQTSDELFSSTTTQSYNVIEVESTSVAENKEENSEVTKTSIIDGKTTIIEENAHTLNDLSSSITTQIYSISGIESTSVTSKDGDEQNSEVYSTTKTSITDSKTTIKEESEHTTDEQLSSTTTQANSILDKESTLVLIYDDGKKQLELETNVSKESTKSFESPTHDDTNRITSENYDMLKTGEISTSSVLTDRLIGEVTDTSKSKNEKKSVLNNSKENYFDVTTEITLNAEITESNPSKIDKNTDVFDSSEFITEKDLYTFINESNKKDSNIELDNSQENSKDGITTQKAINEVDNNLRTNGATVKNKITKVLDLNNNVTVQERLKENKESYYSYTQTPDSKLSTENDDNFTTEIQLFEEDTSLMPTSTSPEQVVVYV